MSGFGGVVSFEVDGDLWATAKFIDGCRLPYIAPSLGGVESLIEQPTIISYWDQGPEKRAEIGIKARRGAARGRAEGLRGAGRFALTRLARWR